MHESPKTMTVPLMVLALLSVIGGGIPFLLPGVHTLEEWLEPVTSAAGVHHAAEGGAAIPEPALMGIAIALGLSGMGMAWAVYRRPRGADGIASAFGPIYTAVRNLYWVDELYETVILRPYYAISRFFAGFDRWVIDGLVNATGVIADIAGQFVKLIQTGYVRNYALIFLAGVVAILYYLIRV